MIKIPLLGGLGEKKSGPHKIRHRKKKHIFSKVPSGIWRVLGILPLIGIFIFLTYTRFLAHPDNVVQQVIVSEESKTVYDSEAIHAGITQYFSGVNFRTYSYTKQGEFDSYIKEAFPLIDTITVARTDQKNTIYIDIMYHPADILLSNEQSQRVARKNILYPVQASDTIQDGLIELRIPQDASELDGLQGIFYHIHSETLLTILSNITEIIEGKDITDILYLPGGQKLHLTYKNKLLLFHLDKSLDSQLAKLLDLKQYYTDFNVVTRLDLGSNNDIIVK